MTSIVDFTGVPELKKHSMSKYHIQTFYFFKTIDSQHLLSVRAWLILRAEFWNVQGLVILGTEGLNTTLAAVAEESLDSFVADVESFFSVSNLPIKRSLSDKSPFRKFVVKVRDEIVSLGRPDVVPDGEHRHLSPEDWHSMLDRDDVIVIDTRNDYEYEIGTFEKALDLNIKEFSEFPDRIKALDTDKQKPHLIFCTGGIRCEKAIFAMEEQGYKNVYQLDGGILNYIEKFPNGKFNGECFVFDSRVAVGQDLLPSQKYSLCPQCGEVGSLEITCVKCEEPSKLCKKCHALVAEKPEYETCSKNCRHHYKLNPHKKSPQQKQFYHR